MVAQATTSTTQESSRPPLYTIRNFHFHVLLLLHDYHLQTLGPLPIISLVCPELESSEICLRTHLFLPLGQKEILVAKLLKNNKSAGRNLKKEIFWENGIMAR